MTSDYGNFVMPQASYLLNDMDSMKVEDVHLSHFLGVDLGVSLIFLHKNILKLQ